MNFQSLGREQNKTVLLSGHDFSFKHNDSFALLYQQKKKTFLSSEQTLFESYVNVHHCGSKDSKTQASQNFPIGKGNQHENKDNKK